jgi:hypothetical protein
MRKLVRIVDSFGRICFVLEEDFIAWDFRTVLWCEPAPLWFWEVKSEGQR